MTETIEQAAEKANGYNLYAKETKAPIFNEGFKAGAKWQLSQPNPHRITVSHLMEVMALWDSNRITYSRMVEILNEIAAGKHKERIEI
jgi:hypothetical protein